MAETDNPEPDSSVAASIVPTTTAAAASTTGSITQATALQTKTTGTVDPNTPPAKESKPDGSRPEWDGNPESLAKLGENEIERGKAMRRYLTKQTQELAEQRRQLQAESDKAKRYEQMISDPRFQQWIASQSQTLQPEAQPQQSLWTQAEWEEAQGNSDKFDELMDRKINTRLNAAEQFVNRRFTELEKAQEIQDIAALYPDFWELHERGILKPLVREIVDSGQGSILDAYHKAKEIEDYFRQKGLQDSQKRVMEKQAAVSSPPSSAADPAVLFVDNPEKTYEVAFENALLGKKVSVKTRR